MRQRQVYQGIDLFYYANGDNSLEYDFIVAAGADPGRIRYRLDGAQAVGLDQAGNLIVYVGQGKFIHHAPVVYQLVNDQRRIVNSSFILQADNSVSFRLARYDHSRPLIIDPGITFASYLGGSGNDAGYAMTRDGDGNVYVAGQTDSSDFPVEAGNISGVDGQDIFVSKFSADGDLLFTTFLGTNDSGYNDIYESGRGIALGPDGKIYLTGGISRVFNGPGTSGAYDDCSGSATYDAFLAVLLTDGSLNYFTCLGGGSGDMGTAVKLDSAGHVYVAGWTNSDDFPNKNQLQDGYGGGSYDAFIAELDPQGNGQDDLLFASYLGGTGKDQAYDLALAGNDRAYLVGSSFDGTQYYGLVATIRPSDHSLISSQNLWGHEGPGTRSQNPYSYRNMSVDAVYGVTVDAQDNVYLTGTQASASAVVEKLDSGGNQEYLRLIGQAVPQVNTYTEGRSVAVDDNGQVYIAGLTDADSLTGSDTIVDNNYNGGQDGFVTRLDADGNILYTQFVGGSSDDAIYGAVVSATAKLDVVGETTSTSVDFPATDGSDNHGGNDVMLARIGAYVDLAVSISDDGPAITGHTLEYSLLVDNAGPDPASNVVVTFQLPSGVQVQLQNLDSACTLAVAGPPAVVECRIDSLATGMMTLISVGAQVNDNTALLAAASVSSDQFDYDASNDSVSHTTALGADVPTLNVGAGDGASSNLGASSGAGFVSPGQLLGLLVLVGYRCCQRRRWS